MEVNCVPTCDLSHFCSSLP